jgi:hypothetical protein
LKWKAFWIEIACFFAEKKRPKEALFWALKNGDFRQKLEMESRK